MSRPDPVKVSALYLLRAARGKAKKDVGHGGLDEWFSGHGGAKGKGEGARWGDWVSISPVERTLKKPDGKTKKIKPGDIVGPCGISKKKEWKEFTNNGKDPLKCMPRQKAYDMPKKERADVAKGKMKAEKKDKGEGKKTTHTPTFKKKKAGTPSFSKCMHKGCEKAPKHECIWAGGRARAWFCAPHYKIWKSEDDREIAREREVTEGAVGSEYGEAPNKKACSLWGGASFDGTDFGPFGSGVKKTPTRGYFFFEKEAKATGRKTGVGESVGLFLPLPKSLAKKFPSLGEEDNSPSHVTLLYLGDFKDREKAEELRNAIRRALEKWPSQIKATLDELEYFDHKDKDRRVPHMSVKFDKDVSALRNKLKKSLAEEGFRVEDSYPIYRPHVTLAYLPGLSSEWEGKVPKGSWSFDEVELWGLPKVHKIKLGPSPYKISDKWLKKKTADRVAIRHVVRKIAGWWAITGPGIPSTGGYMPPVPKGNLLNAIPGIDPAHAALYNGDEPADIMGQAFEDINRAYLEAWGRPATQEEMKAVFAFVFGGFKGHPEHYMPKEMRP